MEGKTSYGSDEGDLSGIGFSLNYYVARSKFAFEYYNGKWDYEGLASYDISLQDFRYGFEVFKNTYLTIGMFNNDIEDAFYEVF